MAYSTDYKRRFVCTRCSESLNPTKESNFFGWVVIGILIAASVVAIHFWFNSLKTNEKILPATKNIPQIRPFSYPEQALPLNETTQWFTSDKQTAPFTVHGIPDLHCLVKLYDFNTQKPVMSVFVHKGSTVKVKIPLGTYELKYATGERWYGYDYLFGPSTVYITSAIKYSHIGDFVIYGVYEKDRWTQT